MNLTRRRYLLKQIRTHSPITLASHRLQLLFGEVLEGESPLHRFARRADIHKQSCYPYQGGVASVVLGNALGAANGPSLASGLG